jgi:hypothetical protein
MSRQYAPRAVLRHLPFDLLREFLDSNRIDLGVDWDAVGDVDVDPVYDAWQNLRPELRDRVEQMFRQVHEMATPAGIRLLITEVGFAGTDITAEIMRLPGHQARALWVLVHRPLAFHNARRIALAESLSSRYWQKITGVPLLVPDASTAARDAFGQALARYYRDGQGRGQRCTVEYYLRGGTEHYFFCYPDDYAQTHTEHDTRGTLRRAPHRPTFELVFAYTPAEGVLDLYVPGDRRTRQEVQDLFVQMILRSDSIPVPERPTYELNGLLDRSFPLPTDPADGVLQVQVRRLRVALPGGNDRVVLEPDPDGRRDGVFDLLDRCLGSYPRHQLNITLATFSIVYRPADGGRDRTLTFDVSWPNSCSLKSLPDDQRALGERCLRRWGILRDDAAAGGADPGRVA